MPGTYDDDEGYWTEVDATGVVSPVVIPPAEKIAAIRGDLPPLRKSNSSTQWLGHVSIGLSKVVAFLKGLALVVFAMIAGVFFLPWFAVKRIMKGGYSAFPPLFFVLKRNIRRALTLALSLCVLLAGAAVGFVCLAHVSGVNWTDELLKLPQPLMTENDILTWLALAALSLFLIGTSMWMCMVSERASSGIRLTGRF